jgi:hypothetical protein
VLLDYSGLVQIVCDMSFFLKFETLNTSDQKSTEKGIGDLLSSSLSPTVQLMHNSL